MSLYQYAGQKDNAGKAQLETLHKWKATGHVKAEKAHLERQKFGRRPQTTHDNEPTIHSKRTPNYAPPTVRLHSDYTATTLRLHSWLHSDDTPDYTPTTLWWHIWPPTTLRRHSQVPTTLRLHSRRHTDYAPTTLWLHLSSHPPAGTNCTWSTPCQQVTPDTLQLPGFKSPALHMALWDRTFMEVWLGQSIGIHLSFPSFFPS